MGGIILVGLFVLVRSLEKMRLGGKVINVSAQKGDIKLSASLHNKDGKENDDLVTSGKHIVNESSPASCDGSECSND